MTDGSIEMLSTESQAWLPIMGICGILLLAAGGLVVRLGAVASGLVLGGMAGWLLWSETQLPVPSWLVMGTCCLVCIALSLLLTRFFIAVLLGLVLSLWVTSLFTTSLQFTLGHDDSMAPLPTMVGSMIVVEAAPTANSESRPEDSVHPGIAFSENFRKNLEDARVTWDSLTETWKLILSISLVGGFLIGLLYGLVLPTSSVMCMSCGWGGLLVLAAGIGLFAQTADPGPWSSGIAMLMAWTAISATGVAIQSIFSGRQSRDDKT
ncbi:MAG: hypothetical protein CMJ40_01580 [Phycisphaerae bacterium]|nr:hypothetical protein [Phycisphaerae bacterium]